MASIPCSFDLTFPLTSHTHSFSSSSSGLSSKFRSQILGIQKRLRWFRSSKCTDSRSKCWSKCRKNDLDSQGDVKDLDWEDVEQYINHMEMLAVEGSFYKGGGVSMKGRSQKLKSY